MKTEDAFNSAVQSWSDSRLKAYLDSRGVPVPQSGKRDELIAAVRLNKHKAATGWTAWTFDTWTIDNLRYIETQICLIINHADETDLISHLPAIRLPRRRPRRALLPATSWFALPRTLSTLHLPLVVAPMLRPRLTWPSRPTQLRIPCLIHGPSQNSRTILIPMESMFRRAQLRTS
jgi:hypothetical protein